MAILDENDTVVLIIDVQEKLLNAVYNKETLEKKAEIISKAADILGIPVIITEQYPKGLGKTVPAITSNISNYRVFEKTSFSALDDEEVEDYIDSVGRSQILLFGIETHICVSQTANALIDAGYEVHLVTDASGSRSENEHNYGLNRINDNGGALITTEIALFELLRSSKHPKFKEIQGLIK